MLRLWSRGALLAPALLALAACTAPLMPAPAADQAAATPVVSPATATTVPAAASATPAELPGPIASPSPAELPEIVLVTPKAAPIVPAPGAATPIAPPQEVPMPQPPVVNDPVAAAVADLAARLGIAADATTVVRAEEVDWPDGSLGCPQPDMRYKQMLVNGSFVQLRVADRLYNYHSGGMRAPVLCTSKDEVLPEDLPGSLRGDPNT